MHVGFRCSMPLALSVFGLFLVAQGAPPVPTPTPAPELADLREGELAKGESDLVKETKGIIGPYGGRLVSPDGAVEVSWAPNPARPPTATRVWSIIAPGGAGFHVDGAAGPASVRCWPPGSGAVPGSPGAAGDPVERGASPPGGPDEGGVEILGPEREWTSVESTLHKDGSREIRFVDERSRLKVTGLAKARGSNRPHLEPARVDLLRGQSARFRWVNTPRAQKDWKDAVAEDEELAPITPVRKDAGKGATPPPKTTEPDDDELAPITPPRRDPDIDDLAPISPSTPKGGTP